MKKETINSSISPDRVQLRLARTGHSVEAIISTNGECEAACTVKLADLKAAIERLESRETVVRGVTVRPFATGIEFSWLPPGATIGHCLEFRPEDTDDLIEAIQRAAGRD